MQDFIFGSNKLTQLLEYFCKLLESFEIKHLTRDFVTRKSWYFLLFTGVENPQKQTIFLTTYQSLLFLPVVLSGILKARK